jgi:hypothetical protein
MLSALALLTALALPPRDTTPAPAARRDDDVTVIVTIDSARHEVKIKAGPFFLPNMGAMDHHAQMDMGSTHDTPVYHFTWPVEGWLRGFKTNVVDADGGQLPKHVMHHMIGINFSRRQLLYPAAERLFGAGTETADATIPATIGVPMQPGMDLGFYIAWHNDTGKDMENVYMTLVLQYSPRNLNPRPVDVMPLYMDANLTVGASNMFDVPPGKYEQTYEFTMPISGRLIGYGGHMHDYGVGVRLEDVASGKVIAKVQTQADKNGKVSGVSRSLPGVRGGGIKLTAGRKYRIVGTYNNLTSDRLINGGMAHISGIFAPDDPKQWPGIDQSDPEFQKDLASLELMGPDAGGEHDHGEHDHGSGSAPAHNH